MHIYWFSTSHLRTVTDADDDADNAEGEQEAQLLLGMADHTSLVVKLSYLRELVWQPSWELDNCPDWLS